MMIRICRMLMIGFVTVGIEMVVLAESVTSSDVIRTTRVIHFNTTPSPDFDRDGQVDFSDFLLFAGKFGSSQGDGRYAAQFDLDGDGAIGFSDFLVFADSFGKEVSGGGSTTTVTIRHPNLRAVIADSLGKTLDEPITRSEMATLTRLDASRSINLLTGLEYATNLTELNLRDNIISDISALSGLTNLTELSLNDNRIRDISVLSGLTNLTELHLGRNSISDISALSGLTNLTYLTLWGNRIRDISPLVANRGLGTGDRIDLSQNPLSATSINTHIPALQGRGVSVTF